MTDHDRQAPSVDDSDGDAIDRYCRGSAANDRALMLSAFSAGAEIISPVSGSMVFRGRGDIGDLLSAAYTVTRDLHWGEVIGRGRSRVVLGEGRVGPFRVTDAMVVDLDADGAIERLRPHLRPWMAITAFAVLMVPRIGRRPGLVLRALRAGRHAGPR